ncbi:MAG: PQQ-binding-like beta-propeller repeat protein, partial [Phycisphaeraceae bacterium]
MHTTRSCSLGRSLFLTLSLVAGFAVTAVTPATAADGWPQFRGPSQVGYVAEANPPLTWSEQENVTWKTPISGLGWSTPIIQDQQIWLTTATPDGKEMFVYCVDADNGEVLFRERLFYNEEPEPLGNAVNGYASPSGAIEPGRFYAHFGSYGTAAINTETFEVLWKHTELECRHFRGPGSSVILFDDKLILTMDGIDVQYLAALDTATGEIAWRTDRSTEWDDYDGDGNVIADGDFRKGYGTPIVYEVEGQTQLLSVGSMAAFAYDPHTGEEIWTVTFNGFNAASSPVIANGLVMINTSTPRSILMAIDPAGTGDITATNVVWEYSRGVPTKPTPVVVDDELIIFVNDGGIATCLDALTGEEIW